MIKLFVGLGNPGPEYAATRHNAGFWWIDQVARQLNATLVTERGFHSLVARANVGGQSVWLLQPQTFMNLSGKSVAALARFYKIAPEEILVAHDELDLAPGTVRLKSGGGAGGHNGLKDTISHIGEGFWRLRFGIGHPGDRAEVIDYVLKRAPAAEETLTLEAVKRAADEVPKILDEGAEKVMNRLPTTAPSTGRRWPRASGSPGLGTLKSTSE